MTFKHTLIGILIAMSWGGNFISGKMALEQIPPIFLMGLRFGFTGLILLPWLRKTINFKKSFIIAFTQMVGHQSFLFFGLSCGLPISASILVFQVSVPIACIVSAIWLKEKLTFKIIFGIIVAFIGISIILGSPNVLSNVPGFISVFIGATLFGISNVQMKEIGQFDPVPFLCSCCLLSAPQFFIISYFLENWSHLTHETLNPTNISSVVYLVCSTIFSLVLWYKLLKIYPVNKVVIFGLLVPVFGIFFAITMLKEVITLHVIVGGLLTILGVAIINLNYSFNSASSVLAKCYHGIRKYIRIPFSKF